MARGSSKNPLLESFFGIELKVSAENGTHTYQQGDAKSAYFTKIEGGEMELTLIEHNVVYQNGSSSTLFIPGPSSFAPITLYQGVTDDMKMWEWWSNVTKGKNVRSHASILVYGEVPAADPTQPSTREEVARWNLEYVWPLKISGLDLDLDSTSAMVASITLVAESIERVDAGTTSDVTHWLR